MLTAGYAVEKGCQPELVEGGCIRTKPASGFNPPSTSSG